MLSPPLVPNILYAFLEVVLEVAVTHIQTVVLDEMAQSRITSIDVFDGFVSPVLSNILTRHFESI